MWLTCPLFGTNSAPMTKTKRTSKGKREAAKQPRRLQARRATRASGLTLDEAKYAALLHDPCTAPLTRPVYPGAGSGFLQRFESDFIIGNGATSTAGAFVFAPGLGCSGINGGTQVSPTGQINNTFYLSDNAAPGTPPTSDSANCTWYNFYPANTAGQAFLTVNAGAYRCVAACMQVFWPGSELNRQGFVSVFRGAVDDVKPFTTAITVAALRASSPYVTRFPQDKLEVKWQPEQGDTAFTSATPSLNSVTSRMQNGVGQIGCTWAGLPGGTGVRIRLVTVYEWQPQASITSGIVMDGGSAPATHGTLSRVFDHLRANANWYISTGKSVAAFLQRSANMRHNAGQISYGDEL